MKMEPHFTRFIPNPTSILHHTDSSERTLHDSSARLWKEGEAVHSFIEL